MPVQPIVRLLAVISVSLFLLSPTLSAADLKETARATMKKSQKAVVPIKLVIKMKMGQQEQEQKEEITGTVIDPSGLTVVSAVSVDPSTMIKALFGSLMKGRGGASQFNVESDVTETALIMEDGTEVEADVVLKDADLDFAFIKPRNAAKPFDHIVLKPRATPLQALDEVFTLNRLGSSENRSPSVSTGNIRSVVKGPRTFYVCDAVVSAESLGCVAFGADGEPVGFFVTKLSNSGGGAGAGMLGSMMGGGGNTQLPIPILRPVEDLIDLANQAKLAKPPEKKLATPPASPPPAATGTTPPAGSGTAPATPPPSTTAPTKPAIP